MNTITEHDRKISEALTALSLQQNQNFDDSPRISRRIVIAVGITIMLAASTIVAVRFHPVARLSFENATERLPSKPAKGFAERDEASRASSAGAPATPFPPSEITGSGYVVALRATTVYSKYEGEIADIRVEAGEHVEAGQPLIYLRDPGAVFSLEVAKAARRSAGLSVDAKRIELAQALSRLNRNKALASVVAGQQLEEAQANWQSATNALAQAEQNETASDLVIGIAQERVDALVLRAPIAGTVTRLNAHIGDSVLARADSLRDTAGLLTIADPKTSVIDADVAETALTTLVTALKGEAVLDAYPGRSFPIVLSRLAPVVSAEKGTISVRFSIPQLPAGIRPGMAARIRLTHESPTQGEAK
ncbi:efflux RND transporter periplasmic adaptor subunit [Oryzifoliimicrobium ureilyticus]|uniref:efflux RND transporter periplasmic adaptor subunit n=1 Tax=Oryzifoliimicrobium ureilyticus TaxID=3113724 RepID=UPI003075FC1C